MQAEENLAKTYQWVERCVTLERYAMTHTRLFVVDPAKGVEIPDMQGSSAPNLQRWCPIIGSVWDQRLIF